MAVRSEQLVEGGSVYLKVQIPRPGAQSEVKLKPARVVDVERAAARIRLLDESRIRTIRFSELEPDMVYLARLQAERDKAAASSRATAATVENVVAIRPPVSNEQTAPAPEQTSWDPDELDPEQTELDLQTPSTTPVVVAAPAPPSSAASADEMRAWVEIGHELRTRIDEKIKNAPREQVRELMTARAEIEAQLANARGVVEQARRTLAKVEPEPVEPEAKHCPDENETTARETRENENEALEMARKKHGNRYTETQRREVLASLGEGMSSKEAAFKHKVSYWTVRDWSKHHTTTARTPSTPRPAALAAAVPAKRGRPRKAVEAVEPELDEDEIDEVEVEVERTADADTVTRENRKLRALLAMLLDRGASSGETAQLAAQNRQLHLVIDLLLGVD